MDSGNADVSIKTPFEVLIGNLEPLLGGLVGELVRQIVGAGQDVQLVTEGDADAVRTKAAGEHFDLVVIVLNNVLHQRVSGEVALQKATLSQYQWLLWNYQLTVRVHLRIASRLPPERPPGVGHSDKP